MTRRPTKTAAALRADLEARLVDLRRQAAALELELELTDHVRARLAGEPNTPDAVRRRYAARRKAART